MTERKFVTPLTLVSGKFKATAVAVALLGFAATAFAAPSVMTDTFNDNRTNTALWNANVGGFGPSVAESNKAVEIFLPSFSSGDLFYARYTSIYQVRGDFDIRADYRLLSWPVSNGVRTGLSVASPSAPNPMYGDLASVVERTSFGTSSDYPWSPREVYLTHFSDGVNGITETTDTSGTLRLVRSGDLITGYRLEAGTWVPVHAAQVITDDVVVSLSAWSHDYAFIDQDIKVAFDNFTVDKGIVVNNGKVVVPIDIKPGSTPNSIKLGSNGTTPVAILSTASFDATQVNPATVTLSGAAVNLKGSGVVQSSFEDIDSDGLLDLVVHLKTTALKLSSIDTMATLDAKTFDGTAITGSDLVRIIP